jgi:hypothetical protein
MSVFSPDVNIDSPLPLPIDGGNPNPVVVTGTVTTSPNVNVHDGSGNTIASTGTSLNVDVTNTVPVTLASTTITGTVAVTQSTSPWVISGTVTANLGTIDGAATAANQATEITDLGTIISNQTNGTQVVSVSNFPADADALAQGSSTSGQLGALEMGATTTAAPVYVTGTTNPLSLDTAGNLRVSSTITNFPALQNVNLTEIGGNVLTTTLPVSGTVTANQGTSPWVVSLASTTITGTVAVTQSTSPWVVSGSVSISNFPVDADAYAQGSTTSGQLGNLTMGAVTTANPAYTTAQTSPLSLDTSGNLRVYVANPAASLVSSSDTVTQITSTGANQTLLATNLNRKKAILFFETGLWSVKFGAVASATSKTYMVASSNTTIEVPVWVGQIDAICTTSGKLVDVTEMI